MDLEVKGFCVEEEGRSDFSEGWRFKFDGGCEEEDIFEGGGGRRDLSVVVV